MKKRIVVAGVLAVLLVTAAYAQTGDVRSSLPDFFKLAQTGTPKDVQAALRKGAQVNAVLPRSYAQYMGKTPLMFAAQYNQDPEVIATLLKAGADAKAKDSEGKTAVDYAQDNDALIGTDAYRQLQEASQDDETGD